MKKSLMKRKRKTKQRNISWNPLGALSSTGKGKEGTQMGKKLALMFGLCGIAGFLVASTIHFSGLTFSLGEGADSPEGNNITYSADHEENQPLRALASSNLADFQLSYTDQAPMLSDSYFHVTPLKSEASKYRDYVPEEPSYDGTFLDVREADMRDVLSGLAAKMGVNILLVESPGEVSFSISGVTPKKAFELLLQQEGLSYIEDGNIYIVGDAGTLESDFFNRMVLTRFDLNYIQASTLDDVLGDLDIPMETVTMDRYEQTLWVQAVPFSLAKVRDVIDDLDEEYMVRVPLVIEQERDAIEALKDFLIKLMNERAGEDFRGIARLDDSLNIYEMEEVEQFVLWVEETPDKVDMVYDMIEEIRGLSDTGLDAPDEDEEEELDDWDDFDDEDFFSEDEE